MSLLSQLFEEQTVDTRLRRPEPSGAILAIDIGSVHTRALLLDVVEGTYRFVAHAEVPTTTGEPWNNAIEGVYQAFQQITEATGRTLTTPAGELIIPSQADFYGVDQFVATSSAGEPIRAVLVGLVPGMSLKSARRAAESIYLQLVDTISLADQRTVEQQLAALIGAQADLLIVAGGTDGGAVESMRKHLATIVLALSLMDTVGRPTVLFAGNRELAAEVAGKGSEIGVNVVVADNVRPALDTEYLDSAQAQLAGLYHHHKAARNPGFSEIGGWAEEGILPTAHGFGRMVHLLGGMSGQNVLGIDLGSAATTVATYLNGERYLNVFGTLGIGHSARGVLSHAHVEHLQRWLSYSVPDPGDIEDYVWNRSLFPQIVPVRTQELELEYAAAREIVRAAVLSARQGWRSARKRGLLPHFDTILLSGAVLTRPPHYGWSVLVALDALLPRGITRLLLDPYGVATVLGTLAPSNPTAAIQVLERGAFIEGGTLIALSGRARQGEIVLRGSLKRRSDAAEEPFEVPFGTLVTLPLAPGARAELTLEPHRCEVDGLERRKIPVTGGEVGVIIDARGRPWRLPRADEQRLALLRQWQAALMLEMQR